ncbi:hypothetical protein WJ970_09935 [Achromobacter xylosoxidans]
MKPIAGLAALGLALLLLVPAGTSASDDASCARAGDGGLRLRVQWSLSNRYSPLGLPRLTLERGPARPATPCICLRDAG